MTAYEKAQTIEALTEKEEKAVEASIKGLTEQARNYHEQFKADFQKVEKAVECKGITKTTCKTLDSVFHEAVMKAVDRASAITGTTKSKAFEAMKTF